MKNVVRQPIVAGKFYPKELSTLSNQAERLVKNYGSSKKAVAAILPHAGWAFSGELAGRVIASIDIPKNLILIGPNHRGVGANLSIDGSDSWAFPFGDIKVNGEIRDKLLSSLDCLEKDFASHKLEHSLEVIIPLFHAKEPDFKIIPIALFHPSFLDVEKLALALADIVKDEDAMIIASSDMTHFKSRQEASRIDLETIEKIKEMEIDFLFNESALFGRLCGVDCVVATLLACKEIGTQMPKFIGYADSGEVSGDVDSVVGYSGFVIA